MYNNVYVIIPSVVHERAHSLKTEKTSTKVGHIDKDFETTCWVKASDQAWEISANELQSQEIINKV